MGCFSEHQGGLIGSIDQPFHSQINAVGASFSLPLWDIPLCHLHNLSTLGVRPDIKPEHLIFFCIMA